MSRIRLLLAAIVLSASTLAAQGGMGGPPPGGMGQGGPGGMGGGRGMMVARPNPALFKDITLSDAQRAKMLRLARAGDNGMRFILHAALNGKGNYAR